MKIAKLIALPAVVALALVAGPTPPSALTYTCTSGANASPCAAGQVAFYVTDYGNHVHVVVTRLEDNDISDDGFYQAPGGVLSFTENLTPGTYNLTATRKGGHEELANITI